MTSLPPHLAEALAIEVTQVEFLAPEQMYMAGAQQLFTLLSERAGFDYYDARIAYQKHEWPMNQTISQHTFWTEGARYQATIDQARIEGIDAQRKRFAKRVGELEAEVEKLKDKLQKAWEEIEENDLRMDDL